MIILILKDQVASRKRNLSIWSRCIQIFKLHLQDEGCNLRIWAMSLLQRLNQYLAIFNAFGRIFVLEKGQNIFCLTALNEREPYMVVSWIRRNSIRRSICVTCSHISVQISVNVINPQPHISLRLVLAMFLYNKSIGSLFLIWKFLLPLKLFTPVFHLPKTARWENHHVHLLTINQQLFSSSCEHSISKDELETFKQLNGPL